MSNFDNLKQQWAQREIPLPNENEFNRIIEKSKSIRKKQRIGQIVLTTTVLVLIAFFFYISAYKNSQVFLGLGIMIGSLVLRIGIEFLAMIKKAQLPPDRDMKSYTHKLIEFYKQRKYIHFIITPVLFLSYIIGFLMLLPSFKQELSAGFYTYIVISSSLIFTALAILISYQIVKELNLLKELMQESL
ncbi:MAG TPA: hypothetical protein VKX40_03785 [Aequorivita sp.]|nr:hypothetical protein [Aequorivita sp.]